MPRVPVASMPMVPTPRQIRRHVKQGIITPQEGWEIAMLTARNHREIAQTVSQPGFEDYKWSRDTNVASAKDYIRTARTLRLEWQRRR